MFRKTKSTEPQSKSSKSRESIPSIITGDMHMLGNLVSEGVVDFAGTIDGNIRCKILTLREAGTVKGEITADTVFIHGTVKGLIKAKTVNLLASCQVEGIIIHEQLAIEDGAFVDGKFKRSDRVTTTPKEQDDQDDNADSTFDMSERSTINVKVLENIRLIR